MAAPALDVRDFKVVALDPERNEVSWSIANTRLNVLEYTFEVGRSEGAAGPFDVVAGPFRDRYVFVDGETHDGSRWRRLHYVLTVGHSPSGRSTTYGPVTLDGAPDLVGTEIRSHFQLLLQEFAGVRCWYLPRRTFGERCEAWEPTLAKHTRTGCKTCFDTSFVRGYHTPIEVWARIDPVVKSRTVVGGVTVQPSETRAILGHFPTAKPDDLIVEVGGRRWRVESIAPSESGRAVVHQEAVLFELGPRTIEFDIPIDPGAAIRDIFTSPRRNATNPHSLAATDPRLPASVFELYRGGARRR